jgi:molybdopterin synthase sulfur carrier subunit
MKIRIRFFARFRELFGPEIVADAETGTSIRDLISEIAGRGGDAIFDEQGEFRRYVILMQNGKRIDTTRAGEIPVADGDDLAVFPPVAGG